MDRLDVCVQIEINRRAKEAKALAKSEVQVFEMNSLVKVPKSGHTRFQVSGGIRGGPAAESL